MECTQEVLDKFQHIDWRSATGITPEAETLIREHIAKMRAVFSYLHQTRGLSPTNAYSEALSAGYSAPGYKPFMQTLFRDVKFRGAGVREHLVLVASSFCFWSEDPELGKLENPWAPLIKLYEAGYTTSFDEDEKAGTMTLLVGYQDAIKAYPLT